MKRVRPVLVPIALVAAVRVGLARAGDPMATVPAPALSDRSKDRPLPAAFAKPQPETLDDLKAIEKHVQEVLAKVIPCTVGLRVGASGSGVIVSADGLILTAGHVS